MTKINIFLFPCLLLINTAHAIELKKEIAKCASLSGDLERLECYDKLSKDTGVNKPIVSVPIIKNKGNWDIKIEKNPVDDTKTITAMLVAKHGKSKWAKPIVLILRCQSKQIYGFIIWDEYLGDDEKDVLIRIGTNTAVTQSWSSSNDHTATFIPEPEKFIQNLLTANNLVAQVTPYNENSRTAIFNTTGLKNIIKPLAESCNWDYRKVVDSSEPNKSKPYFDPFNTIKSSGDLSE